LSGKISLQDFIFAKEVRLGTYSTRSATVPPSAIVAIKAMAQDPRAEPQYGERVPYVVVHGEPGARLVDMVIDPYLLLELDSPYRLNDLYYINKQIIPVLQRVFGLVGANLYQWFVEMPRPVRRTMNINLNENNRGGRIDRYYMSKHCMVCGKFTRRLDFFCDDCVEKDDVACAVLVGRVAKLEREMQHLNDVSFRKCKVFLLFGKMHFKMIFNFVNSTQYRLFLVTTTFFFVISRKYYPNVKFKIKKDQS
jgi:DNA polymerase zeta